MDPLFVQWRNRLSVRGYKSINKWPKSTDIASQYQSTSSDPSPNCALGVLTCIASQDVLKRTKCVFWSSKSRSNLLRWNKLCLMQLVLNPWCLPVAAIRTNALEFQISSHESSKINKCFIPLFINESRNSKFTVRTNSKFLISFCKTL